MLKTTINIYKTKGNYNIFFKNFFNKFILVNKVKIAKFINVRYKEKNFDFSSKKLKKKE